MNVKIRKAVFETNSSSMHSVCVTSDDDRYKDFPKGIISVALTDYSSIYEDLHTVSEKIEYVLTSIPYFEGQIRDIPALMESQSFRWLSEMVFDFSGAKIQLEYSDPSDLGYIEYDNTGSLGAYWNRDEPIFKENMKELIFNPNVYIATDDSH